MSAWGKLLHIFRHVLHTFIYLCNWHLMCFQAKLKVIKSHKRFFLDICPDLLTFSSAGRFSFICLHFLFCFVRIDKNIHVWQIHITYFRQTSDRQSYSHQAVIDTVTRQSQIQSSSSHIVTRQSSGSCHAVIRQSLINFNPPLNKFQDRTDANINQKKIVLGLMQRLYILI